jgi:hypothetical protein
MDDVRLDLLDHTPKIRYQTRKVTPTEFPLLACPQDLLNILRDGTIFHLSLIRFEL